MAFANAIKEKDRDLVGLRNRSIVSLLYLPDSQHQSETHHGQRLFFEFDAPNWDHQDSPQQRINT